MADLSSRLDATALSIVPYGEDEYLLQVESGRGGVRVWLDSIHLADIMHDSGVATPEDVLALACRASDWMPSRLRKRWSQWRSIDSVYVNDGWADGPEAILSFDTDYGQNQIALTCDLWKRLCSEVLRVRTAKVDHNYRFFYGDARLPVNFGSPLAITFGSGRYRASACGISVVSRNVQRAITVLRERIGEEHGEVPELRIADGMTELYITKSPVYQANVARFCDDEFVRFREAECALAVINASPELVMPASSARTRRTVLDRDTFIQWLVDLWSPVEIVRFGPEPLPRGPSPRVWLAVIRPREPATVHLTVKRKHALEAGPFPTVRWHDDQEVIAEVTLVTIEEIEEFCNSDIEELNSDLREAVTVWPAPDEASRFLPTAPEERTSVHLTVHNDAVTLLPIVAHPDRDLTGAEICGLLREAVARVASGTRVRIVAVGDEDETDQYSFRHRDLAGQTIEIVDVDWMGLPELPELFFLVRTDTGTWHDITLTDLEEESASDGSHVGAVELFARFEAAIRRDLCGRFSYLGDHGAFVRAWLEDKDSLAGRHVEIIGVDWQCDGQSSGPALQVRTNSGDVTTVFDGEFACPPHLRGRYREVAVALALGTRLEVLREDAVARFLEREVIAGLTLVSGSRARHLLRHPEALRHLRSTNAVES